MVPSVNDFVYVRLVLDSDTSYSSVFLCLYLAVDEDEKLPGGLI